MTLPASRGWTIDSRWRRRGRTPDRGVSPHNGLANESFSPPSLVFNRFQSCRSLLVGLRCGKRPIGDEVLLRKIRGIWPGVLVLNRGGADLPTRIADIDNGTADAVGSMSLANPDLVERIKTNEPLNAPDPSTFYGGGAKGYTAYPTLAMTAHQ
jgi:hypothetical protein